MMGKLRNKILGALILIGLVPLLFLGGLALYTLDLFHQTDVEMIEQNLLNQKNAEMVDALQRVLATLELQVGFDQVSDIALPHQEFLLEEFLKAMPDLEEIAFVSLSGNMTARFDLSGNRDIDPNLANLSQTKEFQTAIAGENYLGPVVHTLRGPQVIVATPVKNRNGIVIAVLLGKWQLGEFQNLITRSYLGETGYLYLLDEAGSLLAHSQEDRLAGVGFDQPGPESQARYRSFWGEEVVGARKTLSKLGLTLVAEWPTAEADAAVRTVRSQIIWFFSVVFLITLVLTIILTSRIVRPIKVLQSSARRVSKGQFDEPVNIQTRDELEELGTAFNQMMAGLRELEELKKEFVFIAAHELRTPVTAIKGYLSMVQNGEAGAVSQEVQNLLHEVVVANDRLIQLINDLLEVARAEAGRLTIETQATDVRFPVREVLAELAPLASEKHIVLQYDPPGDLPRVLADSQRLKEVLVNLIGNAIKYTIQAGPVIISHEIADNNLVTHVKDSGVGISPEDQGKLFEKFYRVQNKKTRDITGTGLGLFIVKQIIEKMNGKIRVKSQENQGSTFSFSLPQAKG